MLCIWNSLKYFAFLLVFRVLFWRMLKMISFAPIRCIFISWKLLSFFNSEIIFWLFIWMVLLLLYRFYLYLTVDQLLWWLPNSMFSFAFENLNTIFVHFSCWSHNLDKYIIWLIYLFPECVNFLRFNRYFVNKQNY